MKAVQYSAAGRENGRVTDIPYPVCGDNQVIIKVMSAGICKDSERMIDTEGSPLDNYPLVPGHEFSGYIHEVGKNVTTFKIGDRVTADNTVLCGECYFCQKDDPLHCEHFGSLGHNIDGGMAEYVAVNKDKVFHIPDNLSFNAASLTEPVACVMHGLDRLNVQYGEVVLVFGAGPHGQIASMLLQHSNASAVICIAPTQKKLDMLTKKGIETICMDRNDYSIHENAIRARFPHGVDAVFNTTGSGQLIQSAVRMLRPGGRIIQYAPCVKEDELKAVNAREFYFKELSWIVSSCQTHCYGRSLDAMASGVVDADMLVSHEFELDDYFRALDMNMTSKDVIKIILHPNKD